MFFSNSNFWTTLFSKIMPNFWRTGAPHILKIQRFPLSMSILGQKACILGPTIFKIPQPNWYYCLEATFDFLRSRWSTDQKVFLSPKFKCTLRVSIGNLSIPILFHGLLIFFRCLSRQNFFGWRFAIPSTSRIFPWIWWALGPC